jgi:hypothetical protein
MNESDAVVLKFGLTLQQIIDVVSSQSNMWITDINWWAYKYLWKEVFK